MLNPRTWTLPPDLDTAVSAALREWTKERKVERLWARDANLWTGGSEASWLGWLEIVDEQLRRVDELRRVAEDVRQAGFTHALLLGMGGSSLCPEVLRMTFGALPGWPELSVLDSTDPAQVRAAEAKVDLGRTVFIVSSKSGTTLEPNIFKQYFFERVTHTLGAGKAGGHFVAITDPGSKLEQAARADGFRHVLLRAPVDRRALFSALRLRHGTGGHHGARRPPAARRRARDGAGLPGLGGGGQSGRGAGRDPGRPRRIAGGTRSRSSPRPGSTISGRGSSSSWPNRPASGARASSRSTASLSGPPERLRPGSPVRLPPAPHGAGRRPGPRRGGARVGRAARGADRRSRPLPDRGGVLPLGVRDGRRGRDPGHRSFRPAGRRGQQGRDATADGRVRADRPPAGRDAVPRGGRGPALRRPPQRGRAGGRRPDARRGPARSPRADPARATTRRSSPTSR